MTAERDDPIPVDFSVPVARQPGAGSLEQVIERMTRDLLGTDEAWAEFIARFGGQDGDAAP